ncbi:hypothetical protein AC579_1667 [Pseudocercospora musae]|uniref:BTB domain-containing protein n=1 Tax=Pseudocercospora musae TaxID=113226 RepID=A0A139I969_9PEZI|nr:hypothetical protein AC579_1667 [Pseudocercospora musae]
MSSPSAKRKRDDADVVEVGPAKIVKQVLPSTPDQFPTTQTYNSIVRIRAGKAANVEVFEVHKGILWFYSGYFRTAFNGRWKEAEEGAIDMPTISPNIFKHFIHWAYSRRLEVANKHSPSANDRLLLNLWIFGDAHEIPLLQNEVITRIHRNMVKTWRVPSASQINYVYENAMPQSLLRGFLIDIYAGTMSSTSLARSEAKTAWCRDALFDVLQIVWREGWLQQGRADVEKWDVCKYHVHEQGVRCDGSSLT